MGVLIFFLLRHYYYTSVLFSLITQGLIPSRHRIPGPVHVTPTGYTSGALQRTHDE